MEGPPRARLLPGLPNGEPFSLLRMGKSACFAQRNAVIPAVDGQKCLFCPTESRFSCLGWAKTLILPNGTPLFLPLMGKNACFAQRRAVIPATDGQKRLFCPTESCFSCFGWAKTLVLTNGTRVLRAWDTKRVAFGVRQASFAGSGHQKGCFWGTTGEFCGRGTPKRLLLGHARRVLRVRDTKKAVFGARKASFAGSVERRRRESGGKVRRRLG